MKLRDVVTTIQKHYPYDWPRHDVETTARWANWYNDKAFLLCVTMTGKRIEGLALVRPVMKPIDGIANDYTFDHEGSCLFVDYLYARSEIVLRGLIIYATHRFGRRDVFAWQRHGRLRVYDARRVVLRILKERNENVTA
jgi:hypothetical protein